MEPTLLEVSAERASLSAIPCIRVEVFCRLAAGSAAGLTFYAGEIARHELEILELTIKLPGYRTPSPE